MLNARVLTSLDDVYLLSCEFLLEYLINYLLGLSVTTLMTKVQSHYISSSLLGERRGSLE